MSYFTGKVYLLKGHNGSGKTMLLRLLCDLIQPTSGTISKSDYTYGVMIENPSFIEHESAISNLKFLASIQKKIDHAEIDTFLKKVNLLNVANKKVKSFSLGMKQRLAFCQAIMENPDVLLLDEPWKVHDSEKTGWRYPIKLLERLGKGERIGIAKQARDLLYRILILIQIIPCFIHLDSINVLVRRDADTFPKACDEVLLRYPGGHSQFLNAQRTMQVIMNILQCRLQHAKSSSSRASCDIMEELSPINT